MRHYPSGFQALQAMLDGGCALAAAAVPPVVYQALRRSDFRILAAISTSGDYERIVVRRDRDIVSSQDLRGRRIAVASATSAHYFLDMFLAANGLTPGDVTEVYLPAEEVGAAFLAGTVDAAAHWEPNIRAARAVRADGRCRSLGVLGAGGADPRAGRAGRVHRPRPLGAERLDAGIPAVRRGSGVGPTDQVSGVPGRGVGRR
ncbi:MAG: ABC transporter substrate-binding protein [Lamprocystis purpurea]|nr:ABC transporter substrate-binding protein [Lamprocystis purpurea]